MEANRNIGVAYLNEVEPYYNGFNVIMVEKPQENSIRFREKIDSLVEVEDQVDYFLQNRKNNLVFFHVRKQSKVVNLKIV